MVTHPFFDLTSFRTKENLNISYYLTTKPDSAHEYDLDLVSGELYRKRTYCEQKDIWESYSGEINRPTFAMGIVPRLLDQTNEPQSIWVFGKKELFFDSEVNGRAQSQRARIVGGFILQFCENYPCRTYQDWLSRLILVGVNPYDSRFEDVKTMEELKGKVDWSYIKAFAQNGFGRTIKGTLPEPAYRMVGEVEAEKALNFAFKSGHNFSFNEINSLRKNCFYLYDYIWRSQEKVRENMKSKALAQDKLAIEMRRKAKEIRAQKTMASQTVFSVEVKDIAKSEASVEGQNALIDFRRFFLYFYKNYGERYRTCSRFVRPANHKENPDRAWFFAFLTNFLNVEELDYYYLCVRRSWLTNPRLTNGKRRFDPNQERRCSTQDIDEAFEQSVTVMASLRGANAAHHRFIEFDTGIGGSHRQIYSWVPETGKKFSCDARKLEETLPIFPIDVSWKDYNVQGQRGRLDIIR
ncbi:MAG: hypothetical protein NXH75_00145 [Halobacteriovoraceae bacterium]|nr:hypothetical protein [Halobacteriovoraceae bacterium]